MTTNKPPHILILKSNPYKPVGPTRRAFLTHEIGNFQKDQAHKFFLFQEPLSLISPKATKLVRLYCGWFEVSDYQHFLNMAEHRIPLPMIPKQYHQGLLTPTMPTYSYFEAVSTFVWELMTQRLPFVGRNPEYIKTLVENWCAYDQDYLNDKILTRMINDYRDPKHIHYILKYLMNERIFWVTDCPQKRYQLTRVLEYFQSEIVKRNLSPLKSQKQLSIGLNQLTISEFNISCIIYHREFTKATRHIEIPNLFYRLARKQR